MKARSAQFVYAVFFYLICTALPSWADTASDTLEKAIAEKISAVPEFRFLREEANRLGVRVYLFGGTAAAFGHYVKWDLERVSGNSRLQGDRFDYDYTNIFRSTQDFDCVVDGSPDAARKLQRIMAEKFPYLQGNKSTWEVRPLRVAMDDKVPLLDNPDFLNQHTDSNSTGLIEITPPELAEKVVTDLRDQGNKTPTFLRDLTDGSLHYYFSEKHQETSRAQQGLNPPIFSVIRYLTKLFQYELKPRPEDVETIRKIIAEFNPADSRNDYVDKWIEKNGKKLIQHAVNIEYAAKTLDDLGLRQKLIQVTSHPEKIDSLAWWMSREPLKTRPLGEGKGRTAAELGITRVSHETKDFLAYESITRAHTGDPNVLISRRGTRGENAQYGDGFYTKIGDSGAAGTHITIRFRLHPDAREGTDFEKHGDYLVIKNKSAIQVIPESLKFTIEQYVNFILEGNNIHPDDLALLEKMRRRLRGSIASGEKTEQAEQILFHAFEQKNPNALAALNELDQLSNKGFAAVIEKLKSHAKSLPIESLRQIMKFHRWTKDQNQKEKEIVNVVLEALASKSLAREKYEIHGAILSSHLPFESAFIEAIFNETPIQHFNGLSPRNADIALNLSPPISEVGKFIDFNTRLAHAPDGRWLELAKDNFERISSIPREAIPELLRAMQTKSNTRGSSYRELARFVYSRLPLEQALSRQTLNEITEPLGYSTNSASERERKQRRRSALNEINAKKIPIPEAFYQSVLSDLKNGSAGKPHLNLVESLGQRDLATLKVLLSAAGSSGSVAARSARILKSFFPAPGELNEQIHRAIADSPEYNSFFFAGALKLADPKDPRFIELLKTNIGMRINIGLASRLILQHQIKNDSVADELIRSIVLTHADEMEVTQLLKAIEFQGKKTPELTKSLVHIVGKDPSFFLRILGHNNRSHATKVLSSLGVSESELRSLISDEIRREPSDQWIHGALVLAKPSWPEFLPIIEAALKKAGTQSKAIEVVLKNRIRQPSVIRLLHDVIDTGHDLPIRKEALLALRDLGDRSDATFNRALYYAGLEPTSHFVVDFPSVGLRVLKALWKDPKELANRAVRFLEINKDGPLIYRMGGLEVLPPDHPSFWKVVELNLEGAPSKDTIARLIYHIRKTRKLPPHIQDRMVNVELHDTEVLRQFLKLLRDYGSDTQETRRYLSHRAQFGASFNYDEVKSLAKKILNRFDTDANPPKDCSRPFAWLSRIWKRN